MRALAIALAVMGALVLFSSASGLEIPSPEVTVQVCPSVNDQLQGQLSRLAVWVAASSGGKSRLMLDRTQVANPSGNACRSPEWGNVPFAQACPVSELFTAKLGGLGEGTVMGAIALLETSGPGTYLVFAPRGPGARGKTDISRALLVEVSVDSSGAVTYTQHAEARRSNQPFNSAGELPVANVDFSGTNVELRMRWAAETFTFVLQPKLIFV